MIYLVLIIALLFTGCVTNRESIGAIPEENAIKSIEESGTIPPQYSKNDKIGQMLCVGIKQTTLDDELKAFIDEFKPGAIILFEKNIITGEQLKALNSSVKAYYKGKNYIEPFIFVDQEGGTVDRLQSVYGAMHSAHWYYQNSDAKSYVKDLNSRLSEFMFDSPLCPVLDVNAANAQGSIGSRSFVNDYQAVSNFAKEVLIEFQKTNMISVAKHYPGHGATNVDSHYNLPIIRRTYSEITDTDMLPFKENYPLIDAIMVAHMLIPSVDTLPSSLSKKWIAHLREDGFQGLILSDDLSMKALDSYGNIKEKFIKFVNAGGDMGLICREPEFVESIYNELNLIDEKRIDESFKRIMNLKTRRGKSNHF